MHGLTGRVLGLCLLRSGPQDLPYHLGLTQLLVGTLAVLELVYSQLLEIPLALPRVALSIGLLLAFPWLLLAIRGLRARYLQTLAALAAVELLFTALFLPLALAVIDLPPPDPEAPELLQILLGLLTLVLLGWKLTVHGHILRHALDWPRLPALLLALALFLIQRGLYQALFGTPAA
jgi:hypothetical protein